jgi:hypothetical protein
MHPEQERSTVGRSGAWAIVRGLVIGASLVCASLAISQTASASAPAAEVHTVNLTAGMPGNGVCSNGKVISLSYVVEVTSGVLDAVLATSKAAYDALLPADLSDPASASLPAPLLDLSCTTPLSAGGTCEKSLSPNRKLRSQVMCILLKQDPRDPGASARIDVTWVYDGLSEPVPTTLTPH